VAQRKGVSTASVRRWVRLGAFPPPEKNGGKRGRCIWSGSVLNALEHAYLISLKEGIAYGAEVAWTKGKDVGVSWKEKISLLESGHRFGHLRRLWWAKR
jgi:hypothetical protein